MKPGKLSAFNLLSAAAFISMFAAGAAYGQSPTSSVTNDRSLAPNQTLGYSAGKVVKFTYTQSYDCVDEPNDDLDYNGTPAKSDSGEFQTPVCQAGIQPKLSPAGTSVKDAEPLFVLVPMFSIDNDQNPDDAMACPRGSEQGPFAGMIWAPR